MTKIDFSTETLSVKGENLMPFYIIMEAINALGEVVHVCTTTDNGELIEAHKYENPNTSITSSKLILTEKMGRKKSGLRSGAVCGFRSYLVNFDGYAISKSGVKLHNRNGTTIHFTKRKKRSA